MSDKMNWTRVNHENLARAHGYQRLSKPRLTGLFGLNKAHKGERCPFCNSAAVRRRSRFGPFLGCGSYPKCKATRNLSPDGSRAIGPWKIKGTKQSDTPATEAATTELANAA